MSENPLTIQSMRGGELRIDAKVGFSRIRVDFDPGPNQWVLHGVSLQDVWDLLFDDCPKVKCDLIDEDVMDANVEKIVGGRMLALMADGRVRMPEMLHELGPVVIKWGDWSGGVAKDPGRNLL